MSYASDQYNFGYSEEEALQEALRRSQAPAPINYNSHYSNGDLDDEVALQLALAMSKEFAPIKPKSLDLEPPKPLIIAPQPLVLQSEMKDKPIPSAQNDHLIPLIRYITTQGRSIQSYITAILQEIHFIEMPFCGYTKPTIPLSIEGRISSSVQKYRPDLDSQIDPTLRIELLGLYLSPFQKDLQIFESTFHKIITILNKLTDEDIQKNFPIPMDEAQEKEITNYFSRLGLVDLYKTLTQTKEKIDQIIDISATSWTQNPYFSDVLLIDLTKLSPSVATGSQGSQLEEKTKIVNKKPFSPTILELQASLKAEVEERKYNSGPETIMAYGQTVAPKYHLKLQESISNLLESFFKAKEVHHFKKYEEVLDFYDKISQDLDFNSQQRSDIQKALEGSLTYHKIGHKEASVKQSVDLLPNDQYVYMLTVSSQVYRIYETFKEHKEFKEDLDVLLQNFFSLLVDQKYKCQSGMAGRMLITQMKVLNTLMDVYNKI